MFKDISKWEGKAKKGQYYEETMESLDGPTRKMIGALSNLLESPGPIALYCVA